MTDQSSLTAQPVTTLPVIGAALRLQHLPRFVEWLAADQRDLEIQDPCYPDYLDQDWRDEVRQGRALLDSSGYAGRVGIHAAFDGLDLATHDRAAREVVIRRYRESLEFGAELGATHCVLHSPFQWFGSPLVYYASANARQWISGAVHAVIEPLLPTAEQMNCVFVIETIADANSHALIELVRSFNSPFVQLSIDVGHTFVMSRVGGATPDQWVKDAGDLLGHIHFQDTDGHDDRHWGIGDGNINWRAFFRALRTLTHKPRMVLELADVDDIMPSMAWLGQQHLAG